MNDSHFKFEDGAQIKKGEIEFSPSPVKVRPDIQFSPQSSIQVDDVFKEDLNQLRHVVLQQAIKQKFRFPKNAVNNTKYSVWNFIPIVLFNQFKFFFNLFFLLVALSQIVEALRVGFLISFVAPLVFVVSITMTKEGYDDYKRRQLDKQINETKYERIDMNKGLITDVCSESLRVGDLIKVRANERAPADLVILYTTEKMGSFFIRTDQLDGETDWKLRQPLHLTQSGVSDPNLRDIVKFRDASVYCEHPTRQIYEFAGLFQNQNQKESITLENTMWANTVLASQGFVIGLIVYTGQETRSQMNSKLPQSKVCLVDREINFLSKILFSFLMVLAFGICFLNGFHGDWRMFYFRVVLLLSSIIPISLRVNLDLAKLWYCYCINTDEGINGAIARNSNIPEELGRIQFLISDKTGTLTQNDMICKKICTEYAQFSVDENRKDLINLLNISCAQFPDGPAQDYQINEEGKFKQQRRDQSHVIRDMLTALAICNNVTPVMQQAQVPEMLKSLDFNNLPPLLDRKSSMDRPSPVSQPNEPILQASSPDEIALVKFSYQMNMQLRERERQQCTLRNVAGINENYKVLAMFPFTSESKKMSILVKSVETGRIQYYVKGAEVVMEHKIKPQARASLLEFCENLAMDGLRTLVFAQKVITDLEANQFLEKLKDARQKLKHRDQAISKVVNELDNDLEFLGVTGVEDKLQENVQRTIEDLKSAGIQIWMLTGDKVETATSIAISSGLKARRNDLFFMRELSSKAECEEKIRLLVRSIQKTTLIIDGTTLDTILQWEDLQENFFKIAMLAPCVCVCRCSPTQKAEVARLLKIHTKGKRIAAVGDGGNDVGMILEADVGIGIEGKEGMQASLASDFSLKKFGDLKKLILWHGRLSYRRSATLSQFVFHRGLIISIIQALFIIMFYFVAIPIYNGFLMLGYATVYTALPVFSLVFDQDANVSQIMQFPPLYKTLQKGRSLNFKTFAVWVWKSIYQGSVIILFSLIFFNDSYANIVTITFTALIFIELLNVYTQINKYSFQMVLMQVATGVTYFMSIVLLQQYFDTSYIDMVFLAKVGLITAITWLPLHLLYFLLDWIDPSDSKKVMEGMLEDEEGLKH